MRCARLKAPAAGGRRPLFTLLRKSSLPLLFLSSSSIVFLFLFFPLPARSADDVVVPNENLVVDGLPAIPKSLAERVAPYMESRGATFEAWHPLRREMLIGTRFGDVVQIHRVKFPGGARAQLTFYPERTGGARYRPALRRTGSSSTRTSAAASGTSSSGGTKRPARSRCSRTGSPATRAATSRIPASGSRTSPRGGTGRTTTSGSSIRRTAKTERKVLEVSGGGWGVSDWSPDDKTLLVGEYLSANESRYWLVDAATGAKTLATPESKEKVAWGRAVFAKDGKSLYTTTDSGSEFHRLVSLDLASKKITVLTPGIDWDVSSLSLSEDGGKLAFVVNEGGVETLHVLDTATRKEIALPKIPLGTIGAVRFHANGKDLAFSMASARSASDVYSVDVTAGPAGKVERWTESELGGLDRLGARRAREDLVEELRRPDDHGIPLSPAGVLHGAAARDREHPRRPRGPVPARLPRPQQLPHERARRRDDLPERARLVGLRQDVPRARQRARSARTP